MHYVTDDITIAKTPPPLFSLFFFIVKKLTFFTQTCVMFLIVQARSPILHNGHLERYDKQQRNEIVSQFSNRLYFTYVYIVSLFSFVDFTLIVHESMSISINR